MLFWRLSELLELLQSVPRYGIVAPSDIATGLAYYTETVLIFPKKRHRSPRFPEG